MWTNVVKSTVQTIVRSCGYQFVRVPGTQRYESILPAARLAPWNADPEFLNVYNAIRTHTLVDVYRCWELWTLVMETAKVAGAILEVGVWRGGTGGLMAKRSMLSGSAAPVFLCDTFRGVVKAGGADAVYRGGEHANTSPQIVEALLQTLQVTNTRILQGIFPEDTAFQIDHATRFRLCHIDVDVYQSAKDILDWVWDRMSPCGAVVYDDYGFEFCDGIRKVVDEQRNKNDRLVLHNLNGHAIVIKLATP
jgi:O-methyltransferase